MNLRDLESYQSQIVNVSVKEIQQIKVDFACPYIVLRVFGKKHFCTMGFILSSRGHAKEVPFLGDLFSASSFELLITPKVD